MPANRTPSRMSFPPIFRRPALQLGIVLALGAAMCILTEWYAFQTNGSFGFPLDDTWIHLQFARNLRTWGAYSYYGNQMVTSGSTSPLYTFLLAAGFFFTQNEMMLGYLYGVVFFLAAALFLFWIVRLLTERSLIAAAASMLFLLEPHLQWIALSGMETTLFLAGLLAAWYFYLRRQAIGFGVACGILLWTRPEGLLFLFVILLDAAYHAKLVRSERSKKRTPVPSMVWMKKGIVTAAVFFSCYAAFNLSLSGTVFPNTMAAKMKYYASPDRSFHQDVLKFVSGGHQQVLVWFEVAGVIAIAASLIRRRESPALTAILWPLLLYIAYWRYLPVLYQEGRYMMPVLPFLIVVGIIGMREVTALVASLFSGGAALNRLRFILPVFLLIVLAQYGYGAWKGRENYAEYCKYITDRQVRAGLWIRNHLPETAVIATHDVGAIAYYSGRRIVDMVGLVSPDMIENIGSLDRLKSFLIRKKATHLAVLRNWFEVDNVPVLFETDPAHPEVLQVMDFHSGRVHFVPQNVTRMRDLASRYYAAGEYQQAGELLQQALNIDPMSSQTSYWMAQTLFALGRTDESDRLVRNALTLFPSFAEAHLLEAQIALKRGAPEESVRILEDGIKRSPAAPDLYLELASVLRQHHIDTVKADEYLKRYRELSGQTNR